MDITTSVQVVSEVSARVLPNASNTALLQDATSTIINTDVTLWHTLLEIIKNLI